MDLSFNAGVIVDDLLYYSDNYCNAFLSVDLKNGIISSISDFPRENKTKMRLHKDCLRYDDYLIFLPDTSDYIHVYSLVEHEFKCVAVKKTSDSKYTFCGGFIKDNDLWIFPGNREQAVLKYSLTGWNYTEHKSFIDAVERIRGVKEECFYKIIHLDGKVYMPVLGTSSIVIYDLNKTEADIVDTGIENLYSIHTSNSGIIICTTDMKTFKWDCEDYKAQAIGVCHNKPTSGPHIVVSSHDRDYLVPDYGEEILVRENKDCFTSKDSLCIDKYKMNLKAVHFENWAFWGNKILLFPNCGGDIEIIDDNSIKELVIRNEHDSYYRKKFVESLILQSKTKVLNEGLEYSSKDFIDAISQAETM